MKENINESLLNAVNGIINEATTAPSRNRASQRSSRGRAFDQRATNPDAAPRTQQTQQQQGMNMLGPVWDRRPKPNQPNRPTRGDAQNPSERDATSSLSATNARTKNPSFVLGKPLPKNPPRDPEDGRGRGEIKPRDPVESKPRNPEGGRGEIKPRDPVESKPRNPEGGRGRGDGKGGEPTMRLGPDWEGGRERGSIKPVEAIRTQRSDVPFSSPLIPRDLSSSSPMSIPSSMPRPRLPRNPDLTQRSISRGKTDGLGYEYDPWAIPDWDGDGIIDTLDRDEPNYPDPNDQDGDGLPDYADPIVDGPNVDPIFMPPNLYGDDDGDGILNWNDDYDNSDPDAEPPPPPWDTDGDGIPNDIDRNPNQWDGSQPPQKTDSLWLSRNNQIGTEGSPSNPMHMGSASAFIGDPANGKDAARYYWQSAKTYTGKGNRESGMKGGIRFGGGPKASAAQAYSNNATRTITVGGKTPGLDAPEGLGETTMKYGKARELIAEAIEQLDELSDAKMRGYVMKSAYNAAVDAPTHGVKKRLKGIGTALKSMAGYRSKKK